MMDKYKEPVCLGVMAGSVMTCVPFMAFCFFRMWLHRKEIVLKKRFIYFGTISMIGLFLFCLSLPIRLYLTCFAIDAPSKDTYLSIRMGDSLTRAVYFYLTRSAMAILPVSLLFRVGHLSFQTRLSMKMDNQQWTRHLDTSTSIDPNDKWTRFKSTLGNEQFTLFWIFPFATILILTGMCLPFLLVSRNDKTKKDRVRSEKVAFYSVSAFTYLAGALLAVLWKFGLPKSNIFAETLFIKAEVKRILLVGIGIVILNVIAPAVNRYMVVQKNHWMVWSIWVIAMSILLMTGLYTSSLWVLKKTKAYRDHLRAVGRFKTTSASDGRAELTPSLVLIHTKSAQSKASSKSSTQLQLPKKKNECTDKSKEKKDAKKEITDKKHR